MKKAVFLIENGQQLWYVFFYHLYDLYIDLL